MSDRISKAQWIERLGLREHPEGGHYAETFRSSLLVVPTVGAPAAQAPTAGMGASGTLADAAPARGVSTAIHYLLGSPSIGEFSAWHRLHGLEESWYYHYGNDLRIFQIDQAGVLTQHLLGTGPKAQLQLHIRADVWFCAAVDSEASDAYTLVSCAVQPGFDFCDFELADKGTLAAAYPAHRDIIERYTC